MYSSRIISHWNQLYCWRKIDSTFISFIQCDYWLDSCNIEQKIQVRNEMERPSYMGDWLATYLERFSLCTSRYASIGWLGNSYSCRNCCWKCNNRVCWLKWYDYWIWIYYITWRWVYCRYLIKSISTLINIHYAWKLLWNSATNVWQ